MNALKGRLRRIGTGAALLGLLAASAGTAHAQVDRTKQPAPAPAPKATFPSYEEFTLANGIRVFLVKDSRPLVTFRMVIGGGAGNDGATPGVAQAAADLLTKGIDMRPAGKYSGNKATQSAEQFAEDIDFIGGSIQASATEDAVEISASALKSEVSELAALFARAVTYPAYAADEVEKYKQEQIAGLRGQMAQSGWLATQATKRVLYGSSAYGQVVTDKSIAKMTPEAIRSYHKTYFVPENAMIVAVGDLSVPLLKKMLGESALGDWKKSPPPPLVRPVFPERKGRRIILVDRPSSVQSAIRIIGGGPVFNDPQRPKTTILNNILGGGSTGRLYMNLRETHGYTYGAYSGFDANLYAGHFVASADVRNSVTDSAVVEMLREIERIGREDISRGELERTVQSAEGTFLLSVADPNVTAQRVLFIRQYGMPKDYYRNLLGVYRSASTADLKNLAGRYLRPDDLTIVVVGKASEVKPKLEKLGAVEVWTADQIGG